MSVRPAKSADLPALAALALRMHAEAPAYRGFAFDAGKVDALLELLCGGGGCLLVADVDGVIRGGIAGVCTEHWFSTDMIASDLALFVDRQHRNGTTAIRLVTGFVEWARVCGAKRVSLGTTTGVTPESTARLYLAAGLKASGSIFSKDF